MIALFANSISATNDTCNGGDDPTQVAINMANQRKMIENDLTNFNLVTRSKSGIVSTYQFEVDGKVTVVNQMPNGKSKTDVWKWTLYNKCKEVHLNLYIPFSSQIKEYIVKSTANGMVWSEDFTEKEMTLSYVEHVDEDTYGLMESDILGAWKGACVENQENRMIFYANGTFQQLTNENIVNGKWTIGKDGKFLHLQYPKTKTSMRILKLYSDALELGTDKENCTKGVLTFNKLKQSFSL